MPWCIEVDIESPQLDVCARGRFGDPSGMHSVRALVEQPDILTVDGLCHVVEPSVLIYNEIAQQELEEPRLTNYRGSMVQGIELNDGRAVVAHLRRRVRKVVEPLFRGRLHAS